MALIGTSSRLSRRRKACPTAIETKMSRPRLHHSSGTTDAKTTARVTPVTTATTRSTPLASSETGVTSTTSMAVNAASSGWVSGNNHLPTT